MAIPAQRPRGRGGGRAASVRRPAAPRPAPSAGEDPGYLRGVSAVGGWFGFGALGVLRLLVELPCERRIAVASARVLKHSPLRRPWALHQRRRFFVSTVNFSFASDAGNTADIVSSA